MKRKEVKELAREELPARIEEMRKELIKENVQRAAGSAKNPGKMKQMKKNIARMLTRMSAERVQGERHE
ncbi:50S ribosomal protein L29 [Candidatus Woesearchaeota archaeon]|nr:50S ribosomal protein L29 [Candidatus Woesearchaeota archaeon]